MWWFAALLFLILILDVVVKFTAAVVTRSTAPKSPKQ